MSEKRTLGFWEAKCKLGHDVLHGTSMMVACVAFKTHLNEDIFKLALLRLYQRHPLLRAIIREGTTGSFFELSADFSHIPIAFENITDPLTWQQSVEAAMQTMLHTSHYLWRAKILISSKTLYLILTIHHSITDGLSVGNLLHELFLGYDALLEDNHFTWPALALNPNIEHMLIETNSWENYLHYQEDANAWPIPPAKYHNFVPIAQRKSRNIYAHIEPDVSHKIKARCQAKQVTINALLNALLLITGAKMQTDPLTTTLMTPITLRHYCKPKLNQKHLGCNVSMVRTLHENISPKSNLWDLAKAYHKQLLKRIPELGFLPRDFDFKAMDMTTLSKVFGMRRASKRQYFLDVYGLTNLLHIKLKPSYKNTYIEEVNICSNHVAGDFGLLVGVTSIRERLSLVFMYTEPLLEREWVQHFAKHFQETLLQL